MRISHQCLMRKQTELLEEICLWVFFLNNLFVCLFFGCAGSGCCVQAFSSCREQGCSSLQCAGSSLRWLLLLVLLTGFRVQAQSLWHVGFSCPWHVKSFQIRDQTCVPCSGRQIPIHSTTREVLLVVFMSLSVDWSGTGADLTLL